MKISKKLRAEIGTAARQSIEPHMHSLDQMFHDDRINHAVWNTLHAEACALAPTVEQNVLRRIELYRR